MANKKKIGRWFIGIMTLVLLAGCSAGSKQTANTSKKMIEVAITVTKDHGAKKIADKKVSVKERTTLDTIMKENFDVKEQGGIITSINGTTQDKEAGKYWLFDLNGQPATKGAKDIKPENGDKISWDLHGNS
ncbi:DUF4430 domain-containing protein [Enterococcus ratti]|uniref:DUF4430 domain-containing protein n=1 Tax=Enterococcus ratti TaxID=150033 RepID=UPI003516CB5B